jgi:glycosyltransferase involved in cell wall biosynthesis
VVAVCHTAQRNLAQGPLALPEKLVTIYNAAAPARQQGDATLTRKICDRGDFAIVNVARHSKEKDLPTLLSAYALSSREMPSLRLVLVGGGAFTAELKRQAEVLGIAPRVKFLGECTDVGSVLAQGKLFVLSSVSEGMPISLLEAMAIGLPQVVTNVGGMPEIIELSRGGLVVPPRSPEALAEAILRLADDEDFRRDCGENSRQCYHRHFTPDRMTADYLTLYVKGTV